MPLAQEFSLLPTVSAGRVVVAVRGDLDVGTVPALRGALAELIDGHGACSVVIDMEGLTFIDSAGIHALVEALKRLRRGGGDLTLTGVNPGAYKVLDVCALTGVFCPPSDRPSTTVMP